MIPLMKRMITFALAYEPFDEYKKLNAALEKMNAHQISPDTFIIEGDEPGELIRTRLSASLYKEDAFYYITVGKDQKLLIIKGMGLRVR